MRGPYGGLLWPVRTDIVVACLLRGVGAVAFLVPFWAVAELGGVLLGVDRSRRGRPTRGVSS